MGKLVVAVVGAGHVKGLTAELENKHNLAELEHAIGRYCFESIKEYDTYRVRFSGPSRRSGITAAEAEPSSTTPRYQPNQVR